MGWELSEARYYLAMEYEFDDGVNVDGVHYVFENGVIYSYSGSLEEANGRWLMSGTWPYYDENDNKLSDIPLAMKNVTDCLFSII